MKSINVNIYTRVSHKFPFTCSYDVKSNLFYDL